MLPGPVTEQHQLRAGNLSDVPAGTYRFKFKDQGDCDTIITIYTINALTTFTPITVTGFIAKDGLCDQPDASITINSFSVNPANYTFRWVNAGTGVSVGNGNELTGNFTIPVVQSDIIFYIQQSIGSCYSPLVPVSIKVVDKSYFTIPNAFTPNNDRNNDRLTVRVRGYIQLNYFKIYNRWGQIVFETNKLNDGWDGTWKGVLQQTDTYIWIGEGKDLNGNIIKDKGNFVLIR